MRILMEEKYPSESESEEDFTKILAKDSHLIAADLLNSTCISVPHSISPFDSVCSLSCSSKHALLITAYGSVHSYGEGRSGALGHGYSKVGHSPRFTRVTWFDSCGSFPIMCAAGSDSNGCHSLVLAEDGIVFGFGIGYGTGIGTMKPKHEPARIDYCNDGSAFERISKISCGSGCSFALSSDGELFSWGRLHDGRLGLVNSSTYMKCSLRPTKILNNIQLFAYGERHGVAWSKSGILYSWGAYNFGWPLTGEPKVVNSSQLSFPHKVLELSCGKQHCTLIDESHQVWSWGRNQLPVVNQEYNEIKSIAAEEINQLLEEMDPQIIESFSPRKAITPNDVKIKSISCGRRFTFCLTENEEVLTYEELPENSAEKFLSLLSKNKWFKFLQRAHVSIMTCFEDKLFFVDERSSNMYKLNMPKTTNIFAVGNNDASDTSSLVELQSKGYSIYCHLFLAYQRSPVLKRMLDESNSSMEIKSGCPITLNLPPFSKKTFEAVRQYLYTDSFAAPESNVSRFMDKLLGAAELLELNHLKFLCIQILDKMCPSFYSKCCLTYDIGGALDCPHISDIIFLAEDRSIYAQAGVIMNASESLRELLLSAMESQKDSSSLSRVAPIVATEIKCLVPNRVEIVVDDSYSSFHRLVSFIYTRRYNSESTEQLIEDILIAKKYKVSTLYRTCIALVSVDQSSFRPLLQLNDTIQDMFLHSMLIHFSVQQFLKFKDNSTMRQHLTEHHKSFLRSVELHASKVEKVRTRALELVRERNRRMKDDENDALTHPGTLTKVFKMIALMIIGGTAYILMEKQMIDGTLVPVLNTSFFIALVIISYSSQHNS